jgi:hypothetical protein
VQAPQFSAGLEQDLADVHVFAGVSHQLALRDRALDQHDLPIVLDAHHLTAPFFADRCWSTILLRDHSDRELSLFSDVKSVFIVLTPDRYLPIACYIPAVTIRVATRASGC